MDKTPSVKGCQYCLASNLMLWFLAVPKKNGTMNGLRPACRQAGATMLHLCCAAGNQNNKPADNNTTDQHLVSGIGLVPVTSKTIEKGKVRERMVQVCSHQVAEAAVQKSYWFVSTPAECESVK